MKKTAKKIIAIYCKLVLKVGILLPSRKINVAKLKKYEKEIINIHTFKPYLNEKYKNRQTDNEIDLSIIVPVYNVEQYLSECINSLLNNKTKYNIEIIAVNDGSTDGSLKILKNYDDKRLKVVSTKNKGLSNARNVGLDNAVGKYVTFVDSDDYVTDDFIDALMDVVYKKDVDMVRAGYYVLDGEKITNIHTKGIHTANGLDKKILECSGFAWGAVIKRELFYKVRFPVGYIFEDMIIRPLILARVKNYIEIDKCIYFYRQRQGSILYQVDSTIDYRCLDQYYLPREIYNYGLKIGVDKHILKLIIFRELGLISFMRLMKMNKEVKKGVFELNAEFVDNLSLQDNELSNRIDRLYLKSFQKRNYILYILISQYARCKM